MKSVYTPHEIVELLNNHVIGQDDAKKALAIAVRNRFRRLNSDDSIRKEIVPNNILMIGPTGVGKTELVNRLRKEINAPYIKVEATKFTEVGYVGRDVESIARDLVEKSYQLLRTNKINEAIKKVDNIVIDKIIDILLPGTNEKDDTNLREEYRKKINNGELDSTEIEIKVTKPKPAGIEIMSPPGMEDMTDQIQSLFQSMSKGKQETKKTSIKEAKVLLAEDESSKFLNEDDLKKEALEYAENEGIVFIDEIDKIVRSGQSHDVSREGVQRDLLPLIEGTIVNTKYGPLKTDHVLFIASGAFMDVSPSDLISELQGRLPIQVKLDKLSLEDLENILTKPKYSLIKQYQALIKVDAVKLQFTDCGIKSIALAAYNANENLENIGARRLNNVMESILREILFLAPYESQKQIKIDKKYVENHLNKTMNDFNWRDWVI